MNVQPHMSELQRELIAEINHYPTVADAVRALQLNKGFEKVAWSSVWRWVERSADDGTLVRKRIRAAVQILRQERQRALLAEMNQLLCRSNPGGAEEDIRPLLAILLKHEKNRITIHDLLTLLR